jgi:hypothetical protein
VRVRADYAGGHPFAPDFIGGGELSLAGAEVRYEQRAAGGVIRMALADLLALTPDAERITRGEILHRSIFSGGVIRAAVHQLTAGRRRQVLLLVTSLQGEAVGAAFVLAAADAGALADAIARARADAGLEALPDVATWEATGGRARPRVAGGSEAEVEAECRDLRRRLADALHAVGWTVRLAGDEILLGDGTSARVAERGMVVLRVLADGSGIGRAEEIDAINAQARVAGFLLRSGGEPAAVQRMFVPEPIPGDDELARWLGAQITDLRALATTLSAGAHGGDAPGSAGTP